MEGQDGVGTQAGEERPSRGRQAILHQADAYGVERRSRGEAFQAGAVVGMDEQPCADIRRNRFQELEENPALLGRVGRISIGIREVRVDAAPRQAGAR